MLELLDEVADFVDEPFADPSILPTYMLSRFTREHVTVALGGDGGDELLAGYPTFTAARLASLYQMPSAIHRRLVVPLADRVPVSTANFSPDFKLKRFLRGMPYEGDLRHEAWLGAFTPGELDSVLDRRVGAPYMELREQSAGRGGRNKLEASIAYYAETYLTDDILFKVDRASMATSLEVRAPFLDVELVEFLARVPARLKLRRLETKHLLKLAMRDVLPDGIADRPKKGFGIPVSEWLKTDLRERLLDELSAERLRAQGIFSADEVDRLIHEHLEGRRDHRKQLWALLMFQLWHNRYVDAAVPGGVAAGASR
jgi:asparagine synthase (glutamine-hydrolysing)